VECQKVFAKAGAYMIGRRALGFKEDISENY
jgi:hypothetical protein